MDQFNCRTNLKHQPGLLESELGAVHSTCATGPKYIASGRMQFATQLVTYLVVSNDHACVQLAAFATKPQPHRPTTFLPACCCCAAVPGLVSSIVGCSKATWLKASCLTLLVL